MMSKVSFVILQTESQNLRTHNNNLTELGEFHQAVGKLKCTIRKLKASKTVLGKPRGAEWLDPVDIS